MRNGESEVFNSNHFLAQKGLVQLEVTTRQHSRPIWCNEFSGSKVLIQCNLRRFVAHIHSHPRAATNPQPVTRTPLVLNQAQIQICTRPHPIGKVTQLVGGVWMICTAICTET